MGKLAKILIVDDEEDLRKTLCEFLEEKGYKTVEAQNGEEAIEKVNENGFQIIFMDIKLPGMNGTDTYKAIKKIDVKAKTVMMTGYAVENLVNEAIENNAYCCLYKPFELRQVLTTIEQILAGDEKPG